MHQLSDAQKRALLENPNVEEITEKHIHYSSSFKIKAVESYLNGQSPEAIFKEAGFDISFFEENYCLYALKRWKKKYEEEGRNSLKKSETGLKATGRPKNENLDELSYEELKTIVQIQREIITELELKKKLALVKK
jgi:transposase